MFDNNVFIAGTCTNAVENGAVVGYELQTNITYYRGIPLSMVEFIKVEVDGVEANVEDIRISVDHIRVLGEGLSKGKHKVQLTVATRTAYIPVPLVGVKVREVEIA